MTSDALSQTIVTTVIITLIAALTSVAFFITRPALQRCNTLEGRLRDIELESNRLRSERDKLQTELSLLRHSEEKLNERCLQLQAASDELHRAKATIDAMKNQEKDVEARLQLVAQQFVDKAQSVLVQATAERFQGDANTFQVKLKGTIDPLDEKIKTLDNALNALAKAHTTDQANLKTMLENFSTKIASIDNATLRVERVLGNSQARGSWGEFELQRLLELTGMTQHISFDIQKSGYGEEGTGRPDVVLNLPGNLTVPIDAKVPFTAYQNAMSCDKGAERDRNIKDAVSAIRTHIKVLGTREYHKTTGCIGWTIMFVPIEAMLSTLFTEDKNLFDTARNARILIASPLTLLLYLEAFSRGWSLQQQSENAEMILCESKELVSRLGIFTNKFSEIGKHLDKSIGCYNSAVASYEARVGPQARKISELRGDVDTVTPLSESETHTRALDYSRVPNSSTQELVP